MKWVGSIDTSTVEIFSNIDQIHALAHDDDQAGFDPNAGQQCKQSFGLLRAGKDEHNLQLLNSKLSSHFAKAQDGVRLGHVFVYCEY